MRFSPLPILLSLLVLGAIHSAKADILVPNSTYDVDLDNNGSFKDFTVTVGTPQAFTFGAASGTISETQAILGTGQSQLVFTVVANSDLFPVAGPAQGLGLGINDPLNFTAPFDLGSAILSFTGPTIDHVRDDTSFALNPNPFDGSFPSTGHVLVTDVLGGVGVEEIQLTLTSALPTPEPSSLALLATGLATVGGFARRRLSQHAS